MTPHMMRVKHDPPNSYGDCYRTCIACVLDVDPEDVPHPGREGDERWDALTSELDAWLAARGLYAVMLKDTPDNLARHCDYFGYHLIAGRSPRGGHYCVGLGGKVVHNPSPLDDGLEPDEDGTFTIMLLVAGAPVKRQEEPWQVTHLSAARTDADTVVVEPKRCECNGICDEACVR